MERILEEVPYHVFSYQGGSFVVHRGLRRPLKISQEANPIWNGERQVNRRRLRTKC